jgi:hypothetical protein
LRDIANWQVELPTKRCWANQASVADLERQLSEIDDIEKPGNRPGNR